MKNAVGAVLATDTYYVEAFDGFSVSDKITITPKSGISAVTTLGGAYSTGFTLTPKVNMQVNMVIAEYNSKGALINTEVRPLDLAANVSAFEGLDISRENTTKVFFWDSNMVPLTNIFTAF